MWTSKTRHIAIYTGAALEKWNRRTVDEGLAGAETWACELGAEFVKRGFGVTIFNDCLHDGEQDEHGVIYRDYRSFSRWITENEVFSVILSRTCEPLRNKSLACERTYVMVHDIFLGPTPDSAIERDHVRKFACLGHWHQKIFAEFHGIPLGQTLLTSNGVRPHLYRGVEHEQKRNLSVYSSSPDRGLEELLDMVPEIRKAVPDFELVVAYGFHNWKTLAQRREDHEDLARIEKLEAKLQQPGVRYVGRVSKKELAQLQMQAKVWLYPTWFCETFSITLVEQGFAGNAVVTTPLAGLLDTGSDSPLYVEGSRGLSPLEWSKTKLYQENFVREAIEMLTNEPFRREIAERVARRVTRFTWEQAAAGWMREWGLS